MLYTHVEWRCWLIIAISNRNECRWRDGENNRARDTLAFKEALNLYS